ncbi:MAG TPA: hypothetical protein VHS96_00745, partial [Bacteroidia bacterium]|nr:hypothetical protein [Bacteroidia bacterium]
GVSMASKATEPTTKRLMRFRVFGLLKTAANMGFILGLEQGCGEARRKSLPPPDALSFACRDCGYRSVIRRLSVSVSYSESRCRMQEFTFEMAADLAHFPGNTAPLQ